MAGLLLVLPELSEIADGCPASHDGARFSHSRSFSPERELPYAPRGTCSVPVNSSSFPFQDDRKLTPFFPLPFARRVHPFGLDALSPPSSVFQPLEHGHQLLIGDPRTLPQLRRCPQTLPSALTKPATKSHAFPTPCGSSTRSFLHPQGYHQVQAPRGLVLNWLRGFAHRPGRDPQRLQPSGSQPHHQAPRPRVGLSSILIFKDEGPCTCAKWELELFHMLPCSTSGARTVETPGQTRGPPWRSCRLVSRPRQSREYHSEAGQMNFGVS